MKRTPRTQIIADVAAAAITLAWGESIPLTATAIVRDVKNEDLRAVAIAHRITRRELFDAVGAELCAMSERAIEMDAR